MNSPLFRDLHPTIRRLLLARTFRSIGQGALVVDFALYLHALKWSGFAVGLVLGASGLAGAGLSLLIGVTSDRLTRKPFLLAYEGVSLLGGVAALMTSEPLILVVAAIAGQFGRGAMGAAGPFSPAEQAWLAEEVPPERRGRVYSLNAGLGFGGMALGAIFAVLPPHWNHWLPGPLAFRPLFGLVALTAVVNLVLLTKAVERYEGAGGMQDRRGRGGEENSIRWQENRILSKLVLINSLNGVAVGLTGPLISYWFALRFHVGPAEIAPVMAIMFAITAVSSVFTGWLTGRIGIIPSIVLERLIGVGLLVLIPLMPVYWLASSAYVLRTIFYRSSAGAQQALSMGLVRDERRGLAASLNAVSFQLPRAGGPVLSGYLLDAGFFTAPFYAAAFLQIVYLVWYRSAFRMYEPGRTRTEGRAEIGPDMF